MMRLASKPPVSRKSSRLIAAVAAMVVAPIVADAAPKTHTPANSTQLEQLLNNKSGPAGPLEKGDTIELTAGTTYVGQFTLPAVTAGSGYITIQSSAMANLPGPGVRVKPLPPTNHAQYMPKIKSYGNNARAIRTATGAHNYKLIGLEVMKGDDPDEQLDCLIQLGNGTTTTAVNMPYNITIDRCYIHGHTQQPVTLYTKTGIRLDCARAEVINCHISDIFHAGQQAVGVGGINGAGPYLIDNNYIAASGENVLFGGGAGYIVGQVPEHITITRNHLYKDPAWEPGTDTCNFFELKIGKFVTFSNNYMENNWNAYGQSGNAILLKVANIAQSPWFVTEDVTVENNIARNCGLGVALQGDDWGAGHGGNVQRITIRNNLMFDVKSPNGPGYAFQSAHGTTDIVFDHNTIINTGTKFLNFDVPGEPSTGVRYTNNLTHHGTYGAHGTSVSTGNTAISTYFPGVTWQKNVMVNSTGVSNLTGKYSLYPGAWSNPADAFPSTWTSVITDPTTPGTNYANFKIKSGTPYKNGGTDGKDIGADIDYLVLATAGCVSGVWTYNPNTPNANDDFNYTGGLNTNAGGWGWEPNAWTQYSSYTSPATASGSMTYTDSAGNTLKVSGNKLQPAGNSKSFRNLPTANQFVPQPGDVLWVSFRVNHTGAAGTPLPSNHAGFALYSSLNADTAGDELFLGNPGYSGQNWGFNPEGGTRVVAPGSVQSGAPRNVLLLYKLEYGTSNATIKMWINPDITSEQTLGTPAATGTQPGLDPVRSVLFSTGGTASGYQFDEFRIGRTFYAVTPH